MNRKPHPFQKPDCTGQKFGYLTVLGRAGSLKKKGRSIGLWELQCDCGKVIKKPRADFDKVRGQISCGCAKIRKLVDNKRRPRDISNQRFGNLIALKLLEKNERHRLWLCRCDCGGFTKLSCAQLNNKNWAHNCGRDNPDCPYYWLHYPPVPKPLPYEVGQLMKKYLYLTRKLKYKNCNQAIEDVLMEKLIRHCWILYYRRQNGEKFSERRESAYIRKCLSYAGAEVRRRNALENHGGFMFNSENKLIKSKKVRIRTYPEVTPLDKPDLENIKVSKLRFKRR